MATVHSRSASQALFSVFIQPFISQPQATLPVRARATTKATARVLSAGNSSASHFSTSARAAEKTVTPREVRWQKYDNEITARRIYLVDPKTNKLNPKIHILRNILGSYDPVTHRLIQLTTPEEEAEGEIPVCKLVNKSEEFKAQKRRQEAQKQSKKISSIVNSVKTLELNWAIDGNDLGHRLGKVEKFLAEGRKVEIVLAAKKKGRRAEPRECQDVLKRIRGVVDRVPGAKEGIQEGQLGGFFTFHLHGKPLKREDVKSAQSEGEANGDA